MTVIEISDLDSPEFTGLFTSFTDTAWRLETLPVYNVEYEREPFKRFLAGDMSYLDEADTTWIDEVIAPAVTAGRDIGRVHVIERTTDDNDRLAISDYLRFEFECYKRNKAAGDDIRIAWTDPGTWPKDVWMPGCDFWLFDEHTDHGRIVEMHYETDGSFRLAVLDDDPEHVQRAVACKCAAIAASKPFYP